MFIIVFLPIFTAQAELNLSLYKNLVEHAKSGDKMANQLIDGSFNVMMDSILYTHGMYIMHTKSQGVFCFPPDLIFNGSLLRSYTDAYIAENRSKFKGDTNLALVSVLAISERFPCQ